MPKKRKKPDESTYKSSIFGNPAIRVLIVIAVVAFIAVMFLPDLGKMFQAQSRFRTYIKVNGKELFIDSSGSYTKEGRNLVHYLEYLKQYLGNMDVNMDQGGFLYNSFVGAINELTMEEIYEQESYKVGLSLPTNAFYQFARKDYEEVLRRYEEEEDPNIQRPTNLSGHEQGLIKEYRKKNIEKPVNEGVLISKLDIKYRHFISDTKCKIKYSFYGFDDFLNESLNELEIDEEALKVYFDENKKIVVTNILTDVLVFDSIEEADEASQEDDPFIMDKYKNKMLYGILVKKDSGNFQQLLSTPDGEWKRSVLDFGDKKAIFRIKRKMYPESYEQLVEDDFLDELKTKYIKINSDEYISVYKDEAEKSMKDFMERVKSGEDFFKTAKDMNLTIYGETDFFSLKSDSITNKDSIASHNTALRKANNKDDFRINAFTLGIEKVSEVYSTSEDNELGILNKDDYYFLIEPIEIETAEELTEARETTIADEIKSEYERDFGSLKLEDLKSKNNVEVNMENLEEIPNIKNLFFPIQEEASEIDTSDITNSITTPIETTTDPNINIIPTTSTSPSTEDIDISPIGITSPISEEESGSTDDINTNNTEESNGND